MLDSGTLTESFVNVLHVFDLPQLHNKPSVSELHQALKLLAIETPSWEKGSQNIGRGAFNIQQRCRVAPEGVPKYLTSIIASPLNWIQNEEQKVAIWEEASLRLAERSGRTAMPAISRTFIIPKKDGGDFELQIYEPSITGDSLGLKTWAASYLLSKRLHAINIHRLDDGPLRILELGSGTGLVGMAAAAILGAEVILTDLPDIEGNLARNVKQNEVVIQQHSGVARTAVLDWTQPECIISSKISVSTDSNSGLDSATKIDKFPVIVAADSIYSAEHPRMLVNTVKSWLAAGSASRVIVELPIRDGYCAEINEFRQGMLRIGLEVLEDGEETGYDDWGGSSEDELQEVKCWWSIWAWERKLPN
ncbi:uncharacterized protein PV09_00573 [Verruconis gallopava]|uniref:Uncharacterized protein n=1 Tax=Verruconis gallopava TaxID=253628 RepID=A0A0D1Y0M2_9PEZI|nr:uncharacterized protein PV09_00573 [Verruconis gallopava]KIW08616.1 hypothetical protein PV09_00573 [Verruconis gallopava]